MFRRSVYSHLTSASETKDFVMVELKNKTTVPDFVIAVTMMSLDALFNKDPIAFYELVQKCRNPKHEMFGNTLEIGKKWGLITYDGRIHDYTKNIILSAANGDGFDMRLDSPINQNSSLEKNSDQELEANKHEIRAKL